MSKTVHQRFAGLRIKNLIYVYLAQAVAHAAFLEVMTAGDVPRKGDPPSKDMGPRFSTRLSQDAHRPSNHKLNFGVVFYAWDAASHGEVSYLRADALQRDQDVEPVAQEQERDMHHCR